MTLRETAGDGRTHPLVWVLLLGTAVALAWLVWWGWGDFRGMSRAVTNAPLASVGMGFVLLWAALLLLFPVSAVMGLMGLVGTALFLDWRPAWSVLSSETVGFLTNPQVAALPLFLLMGSFAMVAGLSDDVYRLARAALGRYRGGLALATVGGARGLVRSPDHRWPQSPHSGGFRCRKCARRATHPVWRRGQWPQVALWVRLSHRPRRSFCLPC